MNSREANYNPERTVLISYAQNVQTTTLEPTILYEGEEDGSTPTKQQITLYEKNFLKDMSDQDTWMHTLRPRCTCGAHN